MVPGAGRVPPRAVATGAAAVGGAGADAVR
jgi:hypothetical protein